MLKSSLLGVMDSSLALPPALPPCCGLSCGAPPRARHTLRIACACPGAPHWRGGASVTPWWKCCARRYLLLLLWLLLLGRASGSGGLSGSPRQREAAGLARRCRLEGCHRAGASRRCGNQQRAQGRLAARPRHRAALARLHPGSTSLQGDTLHADTQRARFPPRISRPGAWNSMPSVARRTVLSAFTVLTRM